MQSHAACFDPSGNSTEFTYNDVQVAVDYIFDLRAKVNRLGLMGTLLQRPAPTQETPASERAANFDLLVEHVAIFQNVVALMQTGQPFADLSRPMCR